MAVSLSDKEKLSVSVTKFQEKYSRSVLDCAIKSFQWGKSTKQESLEKREKLSRTYVEMGLFMLGDKEENWG